MDVSSIIDANGRKGSLCPRAIRFCQWSNRYFLNEVCWLRKLMLKVIPPFNWNPMPLHACQLISPFMIHEDVWEKVVRRLLQGFHWEYKFPKKKGHALVVIVLRRGMIAEIAQHPRLTKGIV